MQLWEGARAIYMKRHGDALAAEVLFATWRYIVVGVQIMQEAILPPDVAAKFFEELKNCYDLLFRGVEHHMGAIDDIRNPDLASLSLTKAICHHINGDAVCMPSPYLPCGFVVFLWRWEKGVCGGGGGACDSPMKGGQL